MMVQELPRSASNKQQQQQHQQGDDRGDMPMECMVEMAAALGNMDETGRNGARSFAPHRISIVNLEVFHAVLWSWGLTGVAKPGDLSCMDECVLHAILPVCLASGPACCVSCT